MNPETYVGYERLQYLVPAGNDVPRRARRLPLPASLPLGGFGLSGTWTVHAQEATAGPDAELELGFVARKVYLVLGGTGPSQVSVNGRHLRDDQGQRGAAALHAVPGGAATTAARCCLRASPGVQAYDFTFG